MTTVYYIAKSGPTRINSVEAENCREAEALPGFSDWRCPGLNGEDGNMSPSAIPILDFALTPGTVVLPRQKNLWVSSGSGSLPSE